MGGDYTRWTFDPDKDYAAVFKQQGRVDLDADWNEFVEITDRRWRAETMDLGQQCFVPAMTPDAFLITPVGASDFNIGIGRMYVDGLLAECHGLPPSKFDAILGEVRETNPVLYSNQPYFPSPLPPAIGAPNTTDLVYIDVWEREITAIQDPNIREKALAGPDTCTRLQTVWQVKDLPNVGLHMCGDDIPAWDGLIAPSAGRLTTSTIPPNPGATPCILSQAGGYTGLENRLYRVEVHTAGTVDGATPAQFKWSRDNGSVVAGVTGISASGGTNSTLNVTTLGRDSVLRFNAGDWVEVLDDFTEFQGIAGHLAKIQGAPDAANLTLTVSPPVPTAFHFNPSDPSRHTRVRRWDGRADLNTDVNAATGLIQVTAAGPIDIEDGIQVSFSSDPVGGQLKAGDYWIFAARTFDASVEPLVNAPPRGILHHYCRLGYITWGATGSGSGKFSDCRPKLECCCDGECTVTVGDGVDSHGKFNDIQLAINSLGPAGGVVCVGRGVFTVSNTIKINASNGRLTLRGMGAATRIIFTGAGGGSSGIFLNISGTDHVAVDGFFVVSLSAIALIQIDSSSFCSVRNCTLVNLNIASAANFGLSDQALRNTAIIGGRAIVLAGNCIRCDIEKNAILAAKGIVFASSTGGATTEAAAITPRPGAVEDLTIRDNDFLAFHGAIFLNSCNGLNIEYNLIRGLSGAIVKILVAMPGPNGLSRSNINDFENIIMKGLASPAEGLFMGMGIFYVSGFRVNISHNRIAAQAAIVSFLSVEANLESNEIVALIGILSLFVLDMRIATSLIAGLVAGYIQAGILVDLVCEANTWIGLEGISFLSFAEYMRSVGPVLSAALESAGIAANGMGTIAGAQALGEASIGILREFALAATVKIHRNDFFTFYYGIQKKGQFLSADFSIIDNTFALCQQAGVYLGPQLGGLGSSHLYNSTSLFSSALLRVFNLRHLIQSNAFDVSGTAVYTATPNTFIRDNSISHTPLAVEMYADRCDVSGNDITGDLTAPLLSSGLIRVEWGVDDLRIVGNRLRDGAGSGVLLVSDASNIIIEGNEIQNMRQNGVTSADIIGSVFAVSISRNVIRSCAGGAAGGKFWSGGAIVLASGTDVRILGNTITENGASTAPGDLHAVYVHVATSCDISDNLIAGNMTIMNAASSDTGAIRTEVVQGELLIHGNRLRGNGGYALSMQEWGSPGCISVEGNYMDNTATASTNPTYNFIEVYCSSVLHFENNICTFVTGANYTFGRGAMIFGGDLIVNGNTIKMTKTQANGSYETIRIYCVGAHGIATSNLLTGGPMFPFNGTLIQANNSAV